MNLIRVHGRLPRSPSRSRHEVCLTLGVRITRATILCAGAALASCSAAAQVFWSADFENSIVPFCYDGSGAIGPMGPAPSITPAILDLGPPQNHVFQVQINSTNQTQYPWSAWWSFLGCPGSAPAVAYDPAHTFFKFDLQVSLLHPVHVRLEYASSLATRDLDVDVTPTVTNSFQTFVVPISAFTPTVYIIAGTGMPAFPTALDIGLRGDPANPETTWPSAPDNTFMVDNISYIICPPLTIQGQPHAVTVSWPTNTPGFLLQETTAACAGSWSTVTNAPLETNGVNQVVVPANGAGGFFRLIQH